MALLAWILNLDTPNTSAEVMHIVELTAHWHASHAASAKWGVSHGVSAKWHATTALVGRVQ